MTTLVYKTTNTSVVLVSIITLITAISILAFGIDYVVGIFFFVCLSIFFYHRPLFLALLWLVLLLVNALSSGTLSDIGFGSHGDITGYYLLPMDAAYAFTAIYLIINAVVRRDQVARVLKENPFFSIFLFLIALYIVLYTPVYGKSAIGEARKFYFHFLFPLLAMLSIKKPRDLRRLMLAVFVVAACISVAGIVGLLVGEGGYRSINSEGSLVLMLAVFSIIVFHMNGVVVMNRIISSGMLGLFLSIVIITNHRSVWLAGAFGLLLLFGLHRERIVFFGKAVVMSMVVLGLLCVAVISTPRFGSTIIRGASGIIDPYSDATASWRIRGWKTQLDRVLEEKPVFGEGLGGYYGEQKVSPHNAYVQMILKFGLLGLGMYGFLAYEYFRKTLQVRKTLPRGAMRAYLEMGILNVGAAHVYMMAYGIELIMLIFFALALVAMRLHKDSLVVSRVA